MGPVVLQQNETKQKRCSEMSTETLAIIHKRQKVITVKQKISNLLPFYYK